VSVCSAIVSVPVRDAPAVASTANDTTAGPLPKGEPMMDIQPTFDRADQPHPFGVMMAT
jgi:hypothetical protein